MQNRYVGDIGDYVKFAILRALMPGRKLGVAWWLYEDEDHNRNGRHIEYQAHPAKWRHYDPELYDGLKRIIEGNVRSVGQIEDSGLLPGATFHHVLVPYQGSPAERRKNRLAWYKGAKETLIDCDLVFLDPDNGMETAGFSTGTKISGKSISLAEVSGLAGPGRTLVVYHHQTRRKGGHTEEIKYWSTRLQREGFHSVNAIRSGAYSPRVFFLLNAPNDLQQLAKRLVHEWSNLVSWHPHPGEHIGS